MCSSCLGTVAGLGSPTALGVVWFDAHGDFNTPETSPTGFFDGMPLAMLTGSGWEALRSGVEGLRPVDEANVVLVWARDLDAAEEERLVSSDVRLVRPGEPVEAALDALAARVPDVYVHVDLDVLDPSEGQANRYRAEGGPTAAEVAAAVGEVARRFTLRAAAITAYEPAYDPEGTVPGAATAIAKQLVAAGVDGMTAITTAWICLFMPLAAVAVIALGGNALSRRAAGVISTGSVALSFAAAVVCFSSLLTRSPDNRSEVSVAWTWLSAGNLRFELSILVDPLSVFMMLIVSGVGGLIVLYSIGYMHDDDEERRYFAYMAMFVFSMLMLVEGGNLLMLLVGWGLVGLSSYLLIGFWHERPSAVAAAKKAFVMNAVGDATFALALFLLIAKTGTLDYAPCSRRRAASRRPC